MPILKLTQDLVSKGFPCPPERTKTEHCDTEVPGLYVEARRTSPGKGTYYLRYKDADRKTHHLTLGHTTTMSLADARRRAKEEKAKIQLGADPRGEEKARRACITVDEFFEGHYLPYVKPRKRSWQRDEELYRLRVKPLFGTKRLNEITLPQINALLEAIVREGLSQATADHHAKLLRQALNLAVEWDMLDRNPATGVRLFNPDNRVEHYLDEAQLERLLTVLRTHPNRNVCRIALFLLSTGCRLNEALSAQWRQIDRGTRVWRIPAATSKSKRVRSVPLNDSALDVIGQLDTEGAFDHLFINRKTGLPFTTIMKTWSRIRAEAGVPFLRIHDLRHMYASFLVNSGRTLYEVQQILGHSDPSVTQRYAHLSTESLQAAANSASVAIRGATPTAEVPA